MSLKHGGTKMGMLQDTYLRLVSVTNSFWDCLCGGMFLLGTYAIVYYVSSNFLARKKQEHEQELEKFKEEVLF